MVDVDVASPPIRAHRDVEMLIAVQPYVAANTFNAIIEVGTNHGSLRAML